MASAPPLSARGARSASKPAISYLTEVLEALEDPYVFVKNPSGYISLAVAENCLPYKSIVKPYLCESIASTAEHTMHIDSAEEEEEKDHAKKELSTGSIAPFYGDMLGHEHTRRVVAKMLDFALFGGRKVPCPENPYSFKWSNVTLTSGASSALDLLAFALCDDGDACLIPAPYYAAFTQDLGIRSNVSIIDVNTMIADELGSDRESSSNLQVKLTKENLDAALSKATAQGLTAKVILITNPSNPIGICYTKDELQMVLAWSRENSLHVISDELYALTIHSMRDGDPGFISMAEVALEQASGTDSEKSIGNDVHIIHGMSKDFILSGLRAGFLYSENTALHDALRGVAHLQCIGTPTQQVISQMLRSEIWIKGFVKFNTELVHEACKRTTSALQGLGLTFFRPTSALFVLVDLSGLIPGKQPHSWEDERTLFKDLFKKAKIVLVPGQDCHCPNPGWFRICYTAVQPPALEQALKRLEIYILHHCPHAKDQVVKRRKIYV